ncbi:MAG: nucleotide pyrophosphohydrolase [Gammaproteobacteria bacterium]|nr:nucleotide pyrophosphohydrolase [Gammaproteobacteria bacterium]
MKLGEAAASLLTVKGHNKTTTDLLCMFADLYLRIVQAAKVPFAEIVHSNIKKVRGRFLEFNLADLPDFDRDFPPEERLPEHFEIEIVQRMEGKSYMRWNGVFIGDPLTDNIMDPDGYRFHDVFHLSYAAILHWSPIFRGLIKQKRKSRPEIDEGEDGGRARVVEEGLSAWIFSRAKDQGFFEGRESLSFDLLKVVQGFVRGYEVEKCPLSLWEYAILEGYKVFREVRKNEEGIVIGDRNTRTITYKSIERTKS